MSVVSGQLPAASFQLSAISFHGFRHELLVASRESELQPQPQAANPCYMLRWMFKRQTTGSVVCPSCGSLVGVNDEQCYTCGRRNPGLWGFAPLFRSLGNTFDFTSFAVYACCAVYAATLIATLAIGRDIMGGSLFGILAPDRLVSLAFGQSGAIPVFYYRMWWT